MAQNIFGKFLLQAFLKYTQILTYLLFIYLTNTLQEEIFLKPEIHNTFKVTLDYPIESGCVCDDKHCGRRNRK